MGSRAFHKSHRESGIAMIVVLGIVLVVGLMVLAASVTGLIDRGISANQFRSNAAYYVAQRGIDVYKTAVFRNLVDFYGDTNAGWCESPIDGGITDGNGIVILPPNTWTNWVSAGEGEYRVRYDPADLYFVLTSEGRVGDAQSTVQLIAGAGGGPGSAWDNAILARGATPGSRAINGNVAIYGSLHIVRGDIDGTFTISGTAGVFNDYYGGGNETNILGDVDEIVNTDVDLCARVKIAEGNVYLESGAVLLGEQNHPIYSVHLGDGVVCREKDQFDGDCKTRNVITDHHDSNFVHLRYPEGSGINSAYGPYDVDLPVLKQEALDRAFKTDNAGIPVSGCEWLYSGGVVLLPPTDPTATSDTCGDADNFVRWVGGSPGYLEISGDVNIPLGDVQVTGTLLYEGVGTLYVGETLDDADASISFGNGASMRPYTSLSYPLDNVMAVVSTGDVTYGSTAANDPTAALIYAKGTFKSEKQVIIVGAVIAEDFDLGNNVPRIAYHPDVRFAAEMLCLPGTACAGDGVPQNPGILADIAIERR